MVCPKASRLKSVPSGRRSASRETVCSTSRQTPREKAWVASETMRTRFMSNGFRLTASAHPPIVSGFAEINVKTGPCSVPASQRAKAATLGSRWEKRPARAKGEASPLCCCSRTSMSSVDGEIEAPEIGLPRVSKNSGKSQADAALRKGAGHADPAAPWRSGGSPRRPTWLRR